MQFKFPKHPVGNNVHFLSKTNRMIFGQVDMITIVLKGDNGVSIYYGIIDEKKDQHTIDESQVLDNRTVFPQPKFNINDDVSYEINDNNGRSSYATGIVTALRVAINDEQPQEIYYIIDDNWDYLVEENEVLGMSDSIYTDAIWD